MALVEAGVDVDDDDALAPQSSQPRSIPHVELRVDDLRPDYRSRAGPAAADNDPTIDGAAISGIPTVTPYSTAPLIPLASSSTPIPDPLAAAAPTYHVAISRTTLTSAMRKAELAAKGHGQRHVGQEGLVKDLLCHTPHVVPHNPGLIRT